MNDVEKTAGALILALAVCLGPAASPAFAQSAGSADAQQRDSLAPRLEAVASRAQDLAAHFRQMERSVRESPELQEDAGWAPAEEIAWAAQLAGLVGALSRQATALEAHMSGASGVGALASREGMEARLARLRADLADLVSALEAMREELEAMQGVVHGGEGHGHGH